MPADDAVRADRERTNLFMSDVFSKKISSRFSEIVQRDVDLSALTRWRIGGSCAFLVEPRTVEEVADVLRFLSAEGVPYCVIGQTSNLLFDSAGFNGVLLRVSARMSGVTFESNRVRALAGTSVPDVARQAASRGLAGIEHAVGIPGTIGGLVLMNGGSQRKGIGTHVTSVTFVHADGQVQVMSHDECEFSYRHSLLQVVEGVVAEVELELATGDAPEIHAEMDAIVREREEKFPNDEPNCGSTFLSNPSMYTTVGPPGKVIEEAGFKGRTLGGAQVSPKHANFVNNVSNATSSDVLKLIGLIRGVVREQTGFSLDAEVRYVSPEGRVVPAHVVCDELGLTRPEQEAPTNGTG